MDGKQRDRPRGLERLKNWWANWCSDVLLVAGAMAITVGAALIFPPAGWIVGGVLSIAGGVLLALGGRGGDGG